MKKLAIVFLLAVRCSTLQKAPEIFELPEIQEPFKIFSDGKRLFIVDLDEYTIHAYSTQPFRYDFSFGKKGGASGEFKYPPSIQFFNDTIIAMSSNKTSWFTRDGKFIKEKLYDDFEGFTTHMEMRLIPIKENYVQVSVDHDSSKKSIYLLNSEFERIKTLYEGFYDWNQVHPDLKDFRMLHYQIDVTAYKDKIYISDSHKGFYLEVFSPTGDPLFTIDKNNVIERIAVTEDYKQKALHDLQMKYKYKWIYDTLKKDVYSFYEFFPPIRYFHISNDKIYITTYKESDEKHEIVVLNLQGNILNKTFLKIRSWKYYKFLGELDLYTIHSGRLYELLKNTNTDKWEMHKRNFK